MDHPDRVTALAVLDAVPIGDALLRCNANFARRWWHWFFFAQPDKPERAILADPARWYGLDRAPLGLARDDVTAALRDPATVHAMLNDYRAGLAVDRAQDDADRAAGRKLRCPVLALWAAHDDLPCIYDDIGGIWRGWSDDVTTASIACGHHLAEEAPAELAAALRRFLLSIR